MSDISQESQALVLAQRMLRRLPPSLWDHGLETPQGLLYQSMATELTRWLDAWMIVRQCTLLQEADGIDLDILLRDYGLKRYNQRPDNYARQVGRQILWAPKGTLYAVQEVATLLTDSPQLTGRSGRLQPHWWVAMTQPIYMPRTYWQLGDALGAVWYLSLEENDVCLSQYPPPGANTTPWPDGYAPEPGGGPPAYAGGREDVATLDWIRVLDEQRNVWYARVGIGGELHISQIAPTHEPGTSRPVQLLDGNGEVWGLLVEAETMAFVTIPLSTPLTGPTYWLMRDTEGEVWLVFIDQGTVGLGVPPAPLTWRNMTPGGVALDWVALDRPLVPGTLMYAQVHADDVLTLLTDQPAGIGTTEVMELRDIHDGALWDVNLDTNGRAIEITRIPEPPTLSGDPIIVLDPQVQAEYVTLNDQQGRTWYIWRSPVEWAVSDQAPAGHTNVTPPDGPFTWWLWYAQDGTPYAMTVEEGMALAAGDTAPAGLGMAAPQSLGDDAGTRWHLGVGPDGSLGVSDWPPIDFAQAATCLILNDDRSDRWYVRIDPETSEVVVSNVLEPDTIPWQALGELGWLRAPDPRGGMPWYIMVDHEHALCTRHAPPLNQPWGLDARDCPIFDTHGRPWVLTIDASGAVCPEPGVGEDIPPIQPIFYARECLEALRHVEGAGSLTTMWAT